MRRIYESSALRRDDGDPTAPSTRREPAEPQSFRWIDAAAWSRRLLPARLRERAISIRVETPTETYHLGEPVPFEVVMKNAAPMPISLATRGPVPWTWTVDGAARASRIERHYDRPAVGRFRFERGERKRFRKRWDGMFKISEREWEPAGPGEHTIGAALNVRNARRKGLNAETTVRIRAV